MDFETQAPVEAPAEAQKPQQAPPLVSISICYSDGAKLLYPNVVEYSIDIWNGAISGYSAAGARVKLAVDDIRLVEFFPQQGYSDRGPSYDPPTKEPEFREKSKEAMGFRPSRKDILPDEMGSRENDDCCNT